MGKIDQGSKKIDKISDRPRKRKRKSRIGLRINYVGVSRKNQNFECSSYIKAKQKYR